VDENKLHVDDEWKARASAEKRAAETKQQQRSEKEHDLEMPEASIGLLVNTLAMQALSALGQIPDPNTGKAMIFKPLAQHMIDMLAVLEEKTKGNLDAEEQQMLTEVLTQLRIVFVQTPDSPGQQPPPDAPPSPGGSSIVLP